MTRDVRWISSEYEEMMIIAEYYDSNRIDRTSKFQN